MIETLIKTECYTAEYHSNTESITITCNFTAQQLCKIQQDEKGLFGLFAKMIKISEMVVSIKTDLLVQLDELDISSDELNTKIERGTHYDYQH
ncbi:hypothetical protein G7062_10455 [Erysipelothrix sp. HDW6C]|uniref:hypothetical protein n=1 Tax=Erysipelothrix sp. HDW6C TaxID=2714930 RepID=UPI00140829C5|nr:hypothetical protein [Erysipelothrix sp. HDW6C]QIK70698.1 hypothetical protein G7062_10455 [Erysipelothrix sp. HDW6C]